MLALARQHPSFAGVFFEPGTGRLVVASTSTDASDATSVRQTVLTAVGTELGHPQTATGGELALNAVHRVFEYSFLELARHRARIRSHVFGVPGVQSLSVDEQHNRIKVGLSDPSARDSVEQIATDLAIPIQMLSFAHELPVHELYGTSLPPFVGNLQDSTLPGPPTLRDSITVPDNRLRGGYKIQIKGGAGSICTLGFTAAQNHKVNLQRFVTNSHCSLRPHEKDNGIWHQPAVRSEFSKIGSELTDQSPHSCKGGFKNCRHSDASLAITIFDDIQYDPPRPRHRFIALGEIGRTTERSDCVVCEAANTIDTINPVILIKGTRSSILVGETLDKVGQRTGWTYGNVSESCEDKRSKGSVWILCSGVIDFAAGKGDSGSPVFQYDSISGEANLVGMLWGGAEFRGTLAAVGVISPFGQIKKDLGEFLKVCKSVQFCENPI